MKDTPRKLMKNRMWKKHLFWIAPLIFVMGYLFGLYFGIPKHIDIVVDTGENYNKFIDVFNETWSEYCNQVYKEKDRLWEALNITLHNLDECRDIQIDCIGDAFGTIPRVNRK